VADSIGTVMEADFATDPKLLGVLQELQNREPIFHRPELGTTRDAFDQMMDPDFWEVGASGQCYSRNHVLQTLVERYAVPCVEVWETSGFRCAQLSSDAYLVTYTLVQNRVRVTRRATIWRRTNDGWRILYHQGTMVEGSREQQVSSAA
jgi:hypothetical protein